MRPIGLLACLPMVWSCASAGGAGSSTCTSDLSPSLLSLNEVLDSAAVERRLLTLWPAGAGLAVARIGGASGDDDEPVVLWSESLTEAQEAELTAALESASAMPLDTDERAYVFIGDVAGPAPRRVDQLRRCAPDILDRRSLARRIAAEANGLGIERRVVVRLSVFVDADGSIAEVRVDESSGDINVDRAATRVFRGALFSPGQIEGIPVPVWASFPVTFTPR